MMYWHETTAGKGANETCSMNMKYFRENFNILEEGEERELVIWGDRCTGQNNNYYMVCMLMKAVAAGYFTKATQKFLVTGHSYNICDANFALVEKVSVMCNFLSQLHVCTYLFILYCLLHQLITQALFYTHKHE